MIETTYIKLEKAAELLGTDRGTLLIAAIEGRIEIHGLLGQYICARRYQYDDLEREDRKLIDVWETHDVVPFVYLTAKDAAYLMRNVAVHPFQLTKPDKDNSFWVAQMESDIDEQADPEAYKKEWEEWMMTLEITPDMLFMLREDVEAILKSNTTPSRNSVQNRHAVGERAETTYLKTIGGLIGIMLGKTPAGIPQSVYTSQNAIKQAFLAHYPGLVGERTLDDKFSAANKAILQSKNT